MMNMTQTTYVGIDVSKLSLDVALPMQSTWKQCVVTNDLEGFHHLLSFCGNQVHYVMEATGVYHLRLASFLSENGCCVSVVNPLSVKRFCQSMLRRIKTDKLDAKYISLYGQAHRPSLWVRPDPVLALVSQEQSLIMLLSEQRTQLLNFRESLGQQPSKSVLAESVLQQEIQLVEAKITELETAVVATLEQHYGSEMYNVCTVPGMGKRTAALLLMVTGGLKRFHSAAQLCCYLGLTPMFTESGTSIRRKGSISKMGSAKLRKQLYMCSWSAIRFNKQCKDLYERLKAKGKAGKLILVAVMNKLMRQVFSIVKNNTAYSPSTV
ncbi:MAG: IS110 family transposase [Chitinophagaceae bacterium]|nr:MAG: IS110 family transposase [Chitinophagaceae bacterium]